MRHPMASVAQGDEVGGNVEPSLPGWSEVVDDEASGLPAFSAAVAVSLPYPCSHLPPGCRAERGARGARPAYPRVLGTRQ